MIRIMLLFVLILTTTSHVDAQERKVPSADSEQGKFLDVVINGKTIARYMYEHDTSSKEKRHETYKPYVHVMGPDGKTPITKGPGGQFTHHRGIFLGWNKIRFQKKSYDLWHMKTSEIIHKGFQKTSQGKDATVIVANLHWMDSNNKIILDELRTMTFYHNEKDAHMLADFECQLTAVTDDVSLDGDPEHAGFQFRPSDEVSKNKSAKYLFHAEGINPKKDRDLPWVALNYRLGDQLISVQHMNHSDNPKGSIYSAYRDYGRFGSFPKVTLKKGESLKLNYRIRVTLGDFPEREKMALEYADYTK
ncbi:PmoA family protein [Pirellulaceae bacterium]|nr:PmoA family protein [Pirellulaceae bacterium]